MLKRFSHFAALAALFAASSVFAQTPSPANGTPSGLPMPAQRKAPPVNPEFARLMKESAMFVQKYYQNPQPDQIEGLLKKFDDAAAIAPLNLMALSPLIGFFMEAFRANPDRAAAWMEAVDKLRSPQLREAVLNGLLFAEADETKAVAKQYLSRHPEYKGIDPYDMKKPGFMEGQFRNPTKIAACWGAYFASGDMKYPQAILSVAVQEPDKQDKAAALAVAAARLELLVYSQNHPEVKKMLTSFFQNAAPSQKTAFAMFMSEKMQQDWFGATLFPQKERPLPQTEPTPSH